MTNLLTGVVSVVVVVVGFDVLGMVDVAVITLAIVFLYNKIIRNV